MSETPIEQESNRNEDGTFKQGMSGNPNGRPKGTYSIMTILRKKMEEIPLGQTKEWGHQIAEIILDEAVVHRKSDMLKLLVNYMDGMPNQKVDFGVDKENITELTAFLQAVAKKPIENENNQPSGTVGEGAE